LQEQPHCAGPVASYFLGTSVSSSLEVSISVDMQALVETFAIGSMIKVKCYMGYSNQNRSLHLTAHVMEKITSVKVEVK